MRRVSGTKPRQLRRRRFAASLYQAGWWIAVPAMLAGGIFGAVKLGLPPLGQKVLQNADARLIEGTAMLGLRVADIRVEGRETTDREPSSPPSAPGLARRSWRSIRRGPRRSSRLCPGSARQRSSAACPTRSLSGSSSASPWRCGSMAAGSS